jgi:hypothetical protein
MSKHTIIRMTNSLADLRDALIALEKECREEGCKLEDKIDLTGLPTFGGEQPSDTQGIFSWDEENLLTCESTWKIVSREEEEEDEEEEDEIFKGYVKAENGRIFVQIPDPQSRWGFYIADEEQSWDGGLGIAGQFEDLDPSEVSAADKERLGWILEQ